MRPIEAPSLTNNGIVVYTPAYEKLEKVKLEIFYSPKNPIFSWSYCEDSPYKIWEKTDTSFDKGVLFIYDSKTPLKKGFYRIDVTMSNSTLTRTISGSETYAVLSETKSSLYIGLPYSAFPPILVN